ncbi:hypothetical protein K503DRAFT_371442 [Rhizopogon vinicolor AM-OR11-026]|uniref:Uncharacterized protein n=1 Tax=Rhizopogon vinicolor AM-OR11-026 TaxID=1314800 RepID=A0A1B7MS18_9AGAM|nr:hypothetical protein K503DRAFT_371442 [Rhizopogon vinicolor AM-OR11-026]
MWKMARVCSKGSRQLIMQSRRKLIWTASQQTSLVALFTSTNLPRPPGYPSISSGNTRSLGLFSSSYLLPAAESFEVSNILIDIAIGLYLAVSYSATLAHLGSGAYERLVRATSEGVVVYMDMS